MTRHSALSGNGQVERSIEITKYGPAPLKLILQYFLGVFSVPFPTSVHEAADLSADGYGVLRRAFSSLLASRLLKNHELVPFQIELDEPGAVRGRTNGDRSRSAVQELHCAAVRVQFAVDDNTVAPS
jgi:hypothetical protein